MVSSSMMQTMLDTLLIKRVLQEWITSWDLAFSRGQQRNKILLFYLLQRQNTWQQPLVMLWKKQQLQYFGIYTGCIDIMCDNTNAVNMAKNPVHHKRMKHIDVRHHFLHDNVERVILSCSFVRLRTR